MQEEVAECRICRCEGDEERPLFYPCACTGSIKWCHESCLIEWIKVSRSRERCETCGTDLVFKSEYSETTPMTLPTTELVFLGLKRACREVPYLLRAGIVISIWLIFVPVFSASAFNYVRPGENSEEPPPSSWMDWITSRPSPISLSAWETGVWILVAGFFCLFMLASVFEFVRGFEMGEYAAELDLLRQRAAQGGVIEGQQNDAPANQDPGQNNHDNNNLQVRVENLGLDDDFDLFEDDINQREAGENVNNNDIRNDAAEDLVGDQLGFDEWIGLRDPWCLIFNNVLGLCFCVLMFLVTFYVVPESLGRGVLRETSRLTPFVKEITAMIPIPRESFVLPTFIGKVTIFPEQCTLNFPFATKYISSQDSTVCDMKYVSRSAKKLQSYEVESSSVILGLTVTMLFIQLQYQACACSWKLLFSRTFRPTAPLRGLPHQIWKSVLKSTRTIVRVQKVVSLLVFKMIIFPTVLGILIDQTLRPALFINNEDRIIFMSNHPNLTVLLLWMTGITHTLLVTMNLILIRDILHPDVLDGIIRMRDPHGSQFLPLLVEPIFLQIKRTFLTWIIYTAVVLLFISIPIHFFKQLNIFPLPISIRFVSVGLQLPIELILFHMWMLHVLEKSKAIMVMIQSWFFKTMCEHLGLTKFLLPIPIDADEHKRAVDRANRQAGQLHWLDSAPRVPISLFAPRVRPSFAIFRVTALILIVWVSWLSFAMLCLFVPYLVGALALSCLPALPPWMRTDVRLYFLGWVLIMSVRTYGPRLFLHFSRVFPKIFQDFKNTVVFLISGFLIFSISPILCGYFVYLETALTDLDFSDFRSDTVNIKFVYTQFLREFVSKVPVFKAWLAGLPMIGFLSTKTTYGRNFWRYILEYRLSKAAKIGFSFLFFGIITWFLGLSIGIFLWTRSMASDPSVSLLYYVRLSSFVTLISVLVPIYMLKYWDIIYSTYRRFHDSLKDEKYLTGRRLRNYEGNRS